MCPCQRPGKTGQGAPDANRAPQTVEPDVTSPVRPPWDLEKGGIREGTIRGVKAHLENPDTTPEQSHEKWMQDRLDNGWVLGPVKDADKKEHPLLIPYTDLPQSQQIKDSLFTAIVRALSE